MSRGIILSFCVVLVCTCAAPATALSPNMLTVVSNSLNEYDVSTGTLLRTLSSDFRGTFIQFGPDGKLYGQDGNGYVSRYDPATGNTAFRFMHDIGANGTFTFDKNGYMIWSVPGSDSLNRSDVTTGAFLGTLSTNFRAAFIRFGPDGRLYGVDGNGYMSWYDPATGNTSFRFMHDIGPGGTFTFDEDGHMLWVVPGFDTLNESDATTGDFIGTLSTPFRAAFIDFAPDGRLYGVDGNGYMSWYDPASGDSAFRFMQDVGPGGIGAGNFIFVPEPSALAIFATPGLYLLTRRSRRPLCQ